MRDFTDEYEEDYGDLEEFTIGQGLFEDLVNAIFKDGDMENILSALEDLSGYFKTDIPTHTPIIKLKE